jgi:hypothetical protein
MKIQREALTDAIYIFTGNCWLQSVLSIGPAAGRRQLLPMYNGFGVTQCIQKAISELCIEI